MFVGHKVTWNFIVLPYQINEDNGKEKNEISEKLFDGISEYFDFIELLQVD